MANKTLKCRHCQVRFPREDMIVVPLGAFCSYDHAAKHGLAKSSHAMIASLKKKQAERKKEFRENDKPHQTKLTQMAFNSMIRELDKDLPCICCGKPPHSYPLSAGHYKTVAACPELRFDAVNCHGQAMSCNSGLHKYKKGESETVIQGFRKGIIRRYGPEMLEYLDRHHPPKKYTCEELIELRCVFLEETRRLKKGEPPSRNWREVTVFTSNEGIKK